MEQARKTINSIIYPILLSIIGFFLVQTYNELKLIQITLNTFLVKSEAVNSRVNENSERLAFIFERIKELDEYNKERDIWVREWLEKYQGKIPK